MGKNPEELFEQAMENWKEGGMKDHDKLFESCENILLLLGHGKYDDNPCRDDPSDPYNYDNLTQDKIKKRIADTEQKQQRRNLKIHQILKTEEGMEEYRNMILMKLGIFDFTREIYRNQMKWFRPGNAS